MLFLVPLSAFAAPPLPEESEPPAEGTPAETAPAEPPAEPAPTDAPVEGGPEDSLDAGVEGDAGASLEPATDAETAGGIDAAAEGAGEGEGEAEGKSADDDPGMVRGRREGLMPTNRGGIGLFHTTLPDAGDRLTFRFRVHTGFFRKEGFIYSSETAGPDQHARVLGGIAMGFSPAKWGEMFFSINSAANRNERVQEGRQDPEAIFALGDIDFGFKGAWRFKNGIGLGGQLGLGLLSGSERLLTSNVNFWFDGLFAVDIRYLTKKHFPFRFTTNIGWILDNSLGVADYEAITDDVSREVTRFSLGGNHSRVRMRYAIDFPVRFGKERQFGIDPILEWAWDISTREEPAWAREGTVDSALPRTSQWITLGLRANVVSGLHIDAAADIGMVSPSFQWGPPQVPWQMILGLGWSVDPKPEIKEVPAEAVPPPPTPAAVEGRILGTVVDPEGNPVPDAKIAFPGLATGAIVTDAAGAFTSFRFPAGSVAMQIMIGNEVVKEQTADVVDGQDTQITITLDTKPAPATGELHGEFTDASSGKPITNVSMHVVGQGVDEPFPGTPEGLIALELYAGDYRATLSAPGYVDKTVTFTVPEGEKFNIKETMTLDKPPETPNIIAGKNSIKLKGRINYDGNQVAASSHAILDELATFLKYHPEYAKIKIGVHTDDRGAAKQRSDERAGSVKSYLESKGVEPGRVEAHGHGASNPVAVNLTSKGRAKNNRTVISVVSKQ